jgi:hypothetical protein
MGLLMNMSKTLNGCFAGMVLVSLSLWLLARWTAQELSLVYGELLGGAGLPAMTEVALNFGCWAFLGHAFAVALSWVTLLRGQGQEQTAHFLLHGLAATQVGLLVMVMMGAVLPLFTITTQLGSAG